MDEMAVAHSRDYEAKRYLDEARFALEIVVEHVRLPSAEAMITRSAIGVLRDEADAIVRRWN